MKKFFVFLVSLLAVSSANAGVVTEQEALQKARQFMADKQLYAASQRQLSTRAQSPSTKSLYVFNVEDNGGFVIVSGDDRTREILAYSEQGSFSFDDMPDNVKYWIDSYDRQIRSLSATGVSQFSAVSRAYRASIAPLFTFQFRQTAPYNDECPLIGTTRCPAGCVAVAMAQVMNYTRWPNQTTAIPAYTSATNKIYRSALTATTFNWNSMTNAAYARLVNYCAQSVKMDFDVDGSGAYADDVSYALANYFGYDGNVHILYRDAYDSSDWEDLIYNELNSRRPVIYGGKTDDNHGHTFVVNGYNNGLFYVNWGWAGGSYYDGYYALSALQPSNTNRNYELNQNAIVGIQSPTGGVTNDLRISVTKMQVSSSKTMTRNSADEYFEPITCDWALHYSVVKDREVTLGIGVLSDNRLLGVFEYNPRAFSVGGGLYHTRQLSLCKGVDNLTFELRLLYKEEGSQYWYDTESSKSAGHHYVKGVISGNTLVLTNYPLGVADDESPSVKVSTGSATGITENSAGFSLTLTSTGATDRASILRTVKKQTEVIAGRTKDASADTNGDGRVNIADIVATTNGKVAVGSVEGGIILSTNQNVTAQNYQKRTFTTLTSGQNTFTITGLQASTTYYYRAYAKVGSDYVYGDEYSFTTKTPAPTVIYREPYVAWGATLTQVKTYMSGYTIYREESGMIHYIGKNQEGLISYLFDNNGKLYSSTVAVSASVTTQDKLLEQLKKNSYIQVDKLSNGSIMLMSADAKTVVIVEYVSSSNIYMVTYIDVAYINNSSKEVLFEEPYTNWGASRAVTKAGITNLGYTFMTENNTQAASYYMAFYGKHKEQYSIYYFDSSQKYEEMYFILNASDVSTTQAGDYLTSELNCTRMGTNAAKTQTFYLTKDTKSFAIVYAYTSTSGSQYTYVNYVPYSAVMSGARQRTRGETAVFDDFTPRIVPEQLAGMKHLPVERVVKEVRAASGALVQGL